MAQQEIENMSTHICDKCGKEFDQEIELVEDPFILEMSGQVVMTRLCDDCYSDCCGDI